VAGDPSRRPWPGFWTDARLPPDPNAPKRGLSAYMFFANEQRDNVREENPGITFGKPARDLFAPCCSAPANLPSQARSARSSVSAGRR